MANAVKVVDSKLVEAKTFDPVVAEAAVVETPAVAEHQSPHAYPYIITVASAAQSISAWGVNPRVRDAELRSFWIGESWLASVVYSVSIRNASFAWEIVGSDPSQPTPRNTSRVVERLLKSSNMGKGWKDLILKTCADLYTQDNGAFWNIVRLQNRPDAPVVNLVHLDAAQCLRTGDPKFPVIYTDRLGREHILNWWEVRTLEEFPSPYENAFGLQVCAVSRCLLAAEIVQSLSVYKLEKVSGTFAKAIDFVSGPTQQNLDDGLKLARENILNRGMVRYSLPVIIPGLDPTASLSHIHIDLASLPDNFDEDASFRWYVAQLAAAFGVDYQEIAPLMSGNLGSSQQSEIMHLKTRGKGPALIMGTLEDIINDGLIPRNVQFRFLEQDLRSETEKADARFTRSKDRAMRVKSGELDGEAARRIAVEDGDLPEWLADEIDQREQAMPAEQPKPFQVEQGRQEMGANQIEGGIASQEEKTIQPFTLKEAQRIREAVSRDPYGLLNIKDVLDKEIDLEEELE